MDEVLKILSVLAGDSRYESILTVNGEKEVKTMCDVAERLEQRGMERGMERGELIGKVLAYKDCDFSDAEIARKVRIPVSEVKRIIEEKALQLQC